MLNKTKAKGQNKDFKAYLRLFFSFEFSSEQLLAYCFPLNAFIYVDQNHQITFDHICR
jgi:hypothetical protein